jgi:hypothetical protein
MWISISTSIESNNGDDATKGRSSVFCVPHVASGKNAISQQFWRTCVDTELVHHHRVP